ncbi:MAG TPA: hypothetical protein VEI73_15825, partial [Candidatus Acidoferrum sp.]|nr:hypothetical protein [Candidatus Acidoferrum sp.]
GHIKTRLLALDFVLGHPQYLYFETAEEKRRYFVERFDVANTLFTPVREGGAGISFSDGFPMCMASPSPDSSPVVTFTYIDSEHQNLDAYIAHLRTYRPLFLVLPAFQFLYISTASSLQNEAALIFSLLVEGKGLSEMIRYFDLQTKWEREQYGRLTEADVLFLSEARKQFLGSSIDSLYYLWKRNRLPKDIHPEAARRIMPAQRKPFRAITVPGHEAVFGDSKRNWGDGWRFGGASRARSPRTALSAPHQVLQRIAHT